MSHDDEPATGFGRRPELPPRPPVPDDRIHGDTLDAGVEQRRGTEGTTAAPPARMTPGPAPAAPSEQEARLRTGRRRRRWVVFGVGAALLVAGLNVGRAAGSVEQHTTLSHPVAGIRVSSGAGDVEVSGGAPAGTVELTRRVPRGSDTSITDGQSWEGETLVVDSVAGCGALGFGCSVDYELRVPDGTRVTIDTRSGDLQLGGSLGPVDVEAGSGDIEAKRLRSMTLAARSGSGDIDLALARAPSQLTVRTGSGDVDVTVPSGDTYAVDVQTGSGDEDVTVKTDHSSSRTVQIETGSGDIEFGYR